MQSATSIDKHLLEKLNPNKLKPANDRQTIMAHKIIDSHCNDARVNFAWEVPGCDCPGAGGFFINKATQERLAIDASTNNVDKCYSSVESVWSDDDSMVAPDGSFIPTRDNKRKGLGKGKKSGVPPVRLVKLDQSKIVTIDTSSAASVQSHNSPRLAKKKVPVPRSPKSKPPAAAKPKVSKVNPRNSGPQRRVPVKNIKCQGCIPSSSNTISIVTPSDLFTSTGKAEIKIKKSGNSCKNLLDSNYFDSSMGGAGFCFDEIFEEAAGMSTGGRSRSNSRSSSPLPSSSQARERRSESRERMPPPASKPTTRKAKK